MLPSTRLYLCAMLPRRKSSRQRFFGRSRSSIGIEIHPVALVTRTFRIDIRALVTRENESVVRIEKSKRKKVKVYFGLFVTQPIAIKTDTYRECDQRTHIDFQSFINIFVTGVIARKLQNFI